MLQNLKTIWRECFVRNCRAIDMFPLDFVIACELMYQRFELFQRKALYKYLLLLLIFPRVKSHFRCWQDGRVVISLMTGGWEHINIVMCSWFTNHYQYRGNIPSRFPSNFVTFVSEFPLYYMHSDVCERFKSPTTKVKV